MYLYSERKYISQNVKVIFFLQGGSLCGRDPVGGTLKPTLLKTIKKNKFTMKYSLFFT